MEAPIVQSHEGMTLVGGGPVTAAALRRARVLAPRLVAADGGADRALAAGMVPEAVFGDMDSISDAARVLLGPARLHEIAEQDTTDFDKALRSLGAPFVLALGFSGARLDHGLSVYNSLVRHPDRRCIVFGGPDIVFAAPPRLRLVLPVGLRLSLFPMARVSGTSRGLRWPIDGLGFAPDGLAGTSNQVAGAEVDLAFDAPGMLVILPGRALPAVLRGLVPGFRAPPGVRGG